jgi:7-cyano-7-deazaguanine synthase
MADIERALVLFACGLKSAASLAWALDRFSFVETLGIEFSATRPIELQRRAAFRLRLRSDFPRWLSRLGNDHIVKIAGLEELARVAASSAEFIGDLDEEGEGGEAEQEMPGRNLYLFAAAATLARAREITHVVAGISSRGSERPDDRKQAVDAIGEAINLALGTSMQFHVPLIDLDSTEIRSLATKLGGAKFRDLIRELR